jgi:hypothetical protein
MINGWYLVAALAAAAALLFYTRAKRRSGSGGMFEVGGIAGTQYEDLPESNTRNMSPTYPVDCLDLPPKVVYGGHTDKSGFWTEEFPMNAMEEESGKVDDEPILSDGLAAYDQMKNEKPKETRVRIIDDGRANIAAALSKIADQGPFISIEDHGDVIAKALVPLDVKALASVEVEEPLTFGTNDALRNLRQAIMGRIVKSKKKGQKDEHWNWPGKTFTFRKQNVRRVLWNWLSRVPSANSFSFPDSILGSEIEADILLDNEQLKNVCGVSKCIRPDHHQKVTRRSIADYKKP